MKNLNISPDLKLPVDLVTQTVAILAQRGMGKTYTGKVSAEEMLTANFPIVIIDPVGVWWGLRSSADGKKSGFPIVIFGGEHADVPLEVTAGATIAELIVKERISAILDLSLLRKGEQIRFMTAFCENLYHLNREALHVFVDEADAFAPQKPQKGAEPLLGAMEDLVRRGRAKGIGLTLITQRAAVLNKNVLTQISMLVTLRTVSPQDRAAIDAWIQVHGTEEERKEMMHSLPSLPVGTAWFWSPGWLGIFKKAKVRTVKTFDSSATPKVGKRLAPPKKLAEIDMAKIRGKIEATIERAKADDPKELRKKIAELEKDLRYAKSPNFNDSHALRAQSEIRKNLEADLKKYKDDLKVTLALVKRLKDRLAKVALLANIDDKMFEEADRINALVPKVDTTNLGDGRFHVKMDFPSLGESPKIKSMKIIKLGDGDSKVKGGERKILTVLAQYRDGRTKNQVAVLTGYAVNGGGFANYLSSLRTKGYIEGSGDSLRITDSGEEALGSYEVLPSGDELFRYWQGKVGKAARLILEVLREAYPRPLSKEEVAERTGYAASGGGFANALSHLRTLELIKGSGELQLSENLV